MRAGESGVPQMDAIRSQLRSLGYLRGPLGGWMLPGGPSSFLRLNLVSSLCVGLLGGPVLGLPAAAAVSLSNRPHLSSPMDLAALGLYLSVMLGGALAVLQLAADTLLALLARRGLVLVGAAERLAGRVGLLFAGAAALYLAAVLRGGGLAGRDSAAPLAWLMWGAAVLLALAAGHLIGRLTRLSSLVALLAASDAPVMTPAGSRRRRALPLAAGLLLGACVVLILMPRGGTSSAGDPMPVIVPARSTGRIVVIALDGLDAPLMDRAARSGVIPSLARFEHQGARLDLVASVPPVPPAVWTTIATGTPPERHGVLGFESARLPGIATRIQEPLSGWAFLSPRLLIPPLAAQRAPVSGGLRRAPAVWEIASDAGLNSACLNWWATWPARSGAGTVVSERAFARLEAGLAPDREINPPDLQDDLAASFVADLREAREHAGRTADIAPADDQVSVSAAIDGYHALLARRLLARRQHRLVMLYLPGLDLVRTAAGRDGSQAASVTSVERTLRHVDSLVSRIAAELDPADTLIVLGEPGRSHGQDGAPYGVILAFGARVKAGRLDAKAGPLDIAPTLLAMMGMPMAEDLPGAPVRGFLPQDDVIWRLPADVPSYGSWVDAASEDEGGEFDKELLDRLRSLGYIQ